MSTLGNNILLQWWARNQRTYVPTPQLWIEADSWGRTTWKNKGDGGYDLSVVSTYRGTVNGNAIESNFRVKADRNVVGTGSFTVEAVVNWNYSTNVTFLMAQRASGNPVPDGSMQITRASTRRLGFYLYHPAGENIVGFEVDDPMILDGQMQYLMCRWNAEDGSFTKQINNDSVTRYGTGFSCTEDTFNLGYSTIGGSTFTGSLYSFRVYQRALSDAEVASNMALDKARFNF